MQTSKTVTFYDYSAGQFVKADNSKGVHPGFSLPESKQDQQHRQELEKSRRVRQQKLATVSKTIQETHQLQLETQQIKQYREEQSVKILEGLSPEDIEALLEPWHPEPTTQD